MYGDLDYMDQIVGLLMENIPAALKRLEGDPGRRVPITTSLRLVPRFLATWKKTAWPIYMAKNGDKTVGRIYLLKSGKIASSMNFGQNPTETTTRVIDLRKIDFARVGREPWYALEQAQFAVRRLAGIN